MHHMQHEVPYWGCDDFGQRSYLWMIYTPTNQH